VNRRNKIRQCSPGQLTLDPGPVVGTFGKRLVLTGLFLGQRPGSLVAAEERKRGASRFVRAGRTHSRRNGRFRLVLRPRISETVRLHSGSIRGPVTVVSVKPLIRVKFRRGRLVVKIRAARSYAGRSVTVEERRNGRWTVVQHIRLDHRGKAVLRPRLSGVAVRLKVGPRPGYLAGTSGTVRLP
jgi:head-tail adaptor